MDLPLQFPDHAEEVYREAKAFQALPVAERLRLMRQVQLDGMSLANLSPERNRLAQVGEAQKDEWRRTQREIICRYGQSRPTSS